MHAMLHAEMNLLRVQTLAAQAAAAQATVAAASAAAAAGPRGNYQPQSERGDADSGLPDTPPRYPGSGRGGGAGGGGGGGGGGPPLAAPDHRWIRGDDYSRGGPSRASVGANHHHSLGPPAPLTASQLGLPTDLRHYHDYGARPQSRAGASAYGGSSSGNPARAAADDAAAGGGSPGAAAVAAVRKKTEAAVAEAERRADMAEAAQRAVEGMLAERGREVMELNHQISVLKARRRTRGAACVCSLCHPLRTRLVASARA